MVENPHESFLGEEATVDQRWRALHQNVQEYHQRNARVTPSSRIGRSRDLVWTCSRFCIPSEASLEDEHVLNEILCWYRSQHPLQAPEWWYIHAQLPSRLEARLFARGVSPNFDPHWMCCDLREVQDRPRNSNFTIRLATTEDYLISHEEVDGILQDLSEVTPRRVFHLTASRGNVPLGRCLLNITTGDFGIGHLFNMMVVPRERSQGIGAALLYEACEMARKIGCNYITLNATEMGERLYRRFGFQSMGCRPSWSLKPGILSGPPPTTQQIKFLEAVGYGDVEALTAMRKFLTHNQMQDPSLNELTPFQIAARCQQHASASWLLEQGIVPDIISTWDLGWRDRVPGLIAEHPELVEQESAQWAAAPLHIAIKRNDIELATLLLSVPNNLNAKDATFRLTPLGWAHRFQRKEMVSLLEAHPDVDALSSVRTLLESILGKEQIRNDLAWIKAEA